MTCFVAGIVKGLVERNDPFRHFGSLRGYQWHEADAIKCGFIEKIDKYPKSQITEAGKKYYQGHKLSEMPDGRAYFWFSANSLPQDYFEIDTPPKQA